MQLRRPLVLTGAQIKREICSEYRLWYKMPCHLSLMCQETNAVLSMLKLFSIWECLLAQSLALMETECLTMEKEVTMQLELQIKNHVSSDPPYYIVQIWKQAMLLTSTHFHLSRDFFFIRHLLPWYHQRMVSQSYLDIV